MEITQEYVNENIDGIMKMWVNCNTKEGKPPSRSCKSKAKSKLMKDWTYDTALCMLYNQDRRITKIERTLKHENYKMKRELAFLKECSASHSEQIAKLEDQKMELRNQSYLRMTNLKRQVEELGGQWQNKYYQEFTYPDRFF